MAGNRKLPIRLKNPHTWNRCSDTSSKPVLVSTVVSTLELETRAKRKRSDETASKHSSAKVARTEGPRASPAIMLNEVNKSMEPFCVDKSLPCNFPGCQVLLNNRDITDHFKLHSLQARPGAITTAIILNCEKCHREFKILMSMCNGTYNVAALEACKESCNISDEGGEYIEYDDSPIKTEAKQDVIEID